MSKCNQESPDEPSDLEARFNDAHDEWLDRFDRAKKVFEETYLRAYPEPEWESWKEAPCAAREADDACKPGAFEGDLFDLGVALMKANKGARS